MRPLLALCALAAMTGAALAAPPPGVYDFQDQADAQACSHVCEEDSLCVAWTFGGAGKCGLMAAAPHTPGEAGWVSGFSPNAPGFVRVDESPSAAPAASQTDTSDALAQHAALQPETQAESALLGGPDESALRSRLQ